jgi:hypothetical protein
MKIDPALLTQLIVAVITLLGVMANYLKSRTNGQKLDKNTVITTAAAGQTSDIHEATNGKLDALTQAVMSALQAAASAAPAAQARATMQDVAAAKVMADDSAKVALAAQPSGPTP